MIHHITKGGTASHEQRRVLETHLSCIRKPRKGQNINIIKAPKNADTEWQDETLPSHSTQWKDISVCKSYKTDSFVHIYICIFYHYININKVIY